MSETVYISGPMSGLTNYNRHNFNALARVLREGGKRVLNPAEVSIQDGTWSDYMKADLAMMMEADRLQMLSRWEESDGARTEAMIAALLRIPVTGPKFDGPVPRSALLHAGIELLMEKYAEAIQEETHAKGNRRKG